MVSDLMIQGVLRMPYEMAMESELSRIQFHDRAQQAANELEANAATIARLEDRLELWPVDPATGEFDKSMKLGESCDGISCRDETIKLLDERCERLELEDKRLTMMLAEYVRLDNAGMIPLDSEAEITRLEGELFSATFTTKTFEEGYDEQTKARLYLEKKVTRLEAIETATRKILYNFDAGLGVSVKDVRRALSVDTKSSQESIADAAMRLGGVDSTQECIGCEGVVCPVHGTAVDTNSSEGE
jgi:hypothetical protein